MPAQPLIAIASEEPDGPVRYDERGAREGMRQRDAAADQRRLPVGCQMPMHLRSM